MTRPSDETMPRTRAGRMLLGKNAGGDPATTEWLLNDILVIEREAIEEDRTRGPLPRYVTVTPDEGAIITIAVPWAQIEAAVRTAGYEIVPAGPPSMGAVTGLPSFSSSAEVIGQTLDQGTMRRTLHALTVGPGGLARCAHGHDSSECDYHAALLVDEYDRQLREQERLTWTYSGKCPKCGFVMEAELPALPSKEVGP